MVAPVLLSLLPTVAGIIDKIITDPAARDAAKLALAQTNLEAELRPLLAQIEVNKVEAASNSLFVAGWRPAVGWMCVLAVGWHFVVMDFFIFLVNILAEVLDLTISIPSLPSLDIQELLGLLMAMLGIGTMRSFDKKNGVAG